MPPFTHVIDYLTVAALVGLAIGHAVRAARTSRLREYLYSAGFALAALLLLTYRMGAW